MDASSDGRADGSDECRSKTGSATWCADGSMDVSRDGAEDTVEVGDSGEAVDGGETGDAADGGDTTDSGDAGNGPDEESPYEKDVSLPVSCDSQHSEVAILEPDMFQGPDDFQEAFKAQDKRIFCLKPGDYRDLGGQWGLYLKTGGAEGQRRYLVHYNPATPSDTHPWNMDSPDQKTGDKRVLLPRVVIASPYWTLDRLRIDGDKGLLTVKEEGHHAILNRLMFYQFGGQPDNQAVSTKDTHHVWIQNSVIGGFPQWDVGDETCCFDRGTSGDDNLALLVVDSDDIYFVDNESWNPFNGDIVQTQVVNTQQPSIKRTVIADNDMWLTDAMRNQPYENAIDFKKGPDGGPREGWAVVQNNRIWGFDNQEDMMSWQVVTTHGDSTTSGYIIRDNVFWDNQAAAVSLSTNDSKNIVEGNVIYNHETQFSKGGLALSAMGESRVANNILIDSASPSFWNVEDSTPHNTTVTHNVFINSDVDASQHEPANTVTANAFYNSTPFQGSNSNSIVEPDASAAAHDDRTVRVREITGPETV
ncbi:MAG: hypothetical protein ABEN55_08400, partial [Bradymonadaceae bacterium]